MLKKSLHNSYEMRSIYRMNIVYESVLGEVQKQFRNSQFISLSTQTMKWELYTVNFNYLER